MDQARSIASVLYHRLQRLSLPQLAGHDVTWAQRTPTSAPAVAHELTGLRPSPPSRGVVAG